MNTACLSPDCAELLRRLRQHGLLNADQIRELTDAQTTESTPFQLAETLVQRGWLTGYQAQHLLENHLERLELAGFRLLEPIGAGGMGEVYRALQLTLNRVVAIKLIQADFAAGHAEAKVRFRREALAVARLSHPNIVH